MGSFSSCISKATTNIVRSKTKIEDFNTKKIRYHFLRDWSTVYKLELSAFNKMSYNKNVSFFIRVNKIFTYKMGGDAGSQLFAMHFMPFFTTHPPCNDLSSL